MIVRWLLMLASLLACPPLVALADTYRCTHEVLPGESLSRIARHHRIPVAGLKKLNSVKGALRAGQKLTIRSPTPCRSRLRAAYSVRRGDTLSGITKKHGMSPALVRRLNPKVKASLRPGQRLWVVVESKPSGGDRVPGLLVFSAGPGYRVRNPSRAWGTFLTINRLIEVLSAHHLRYPKAPPLWVDDISRKGGGYLAPHRSHRQGRDADIRYPLKRSIDYHVVATPATLDVPRTWDLLFAFIKTNDVVYIFVGHRLQRVLYKHAKEQGVSEELLKEYFQYPRSRSSMVGIIRHEPGHRTHLHVRFRKDKAPEAPSS